MINSAEPKKPKNVLGAKHPSLNPAKPMKGRPQPGEGMYYVARLPLQVTGDDIRDVGAEVPEAFGWVKTNAFISQGRLVFIPSKPPEPPKRTQAKNPGLGASESSVMTPSPAANEAPKSGADSLAKPEAPKHGRPRGAPK